MKNLAQLKVLIVGLGQIGGSIALDLVQRASVAKVIGFDREQTIAARAQRMGAVHTAVHSLEEGLRHADLVILAVPVREIIRLLPLLADSINDDMTIMDVGSTKGEILETVSRLGIQASYIGGHPLAGSEQYGLSSAEPGKFNNRTFALIPSAKTDQRRLQTVKALVKGLGANPLILTVEEHDRLIAFTSHLPYVISLALIRVAAQYADQSGNVRNLIGGSFRSATRVAVSSPDLTLDMFLTNRKNIPLVIDEFIAQLSTIKKMIGAGDERLLQTLVTEVRKNNREFHDG